MNGEESTGSRLWWAWAAALGSASGECTSHGGWGLACERRPHRPGRLLSNRQHLFLTPVDEAHSQMLKRPNATLAGQNRPGPGTSHRASEKPSRHCQRGIWSILSWFQMRSTAGLPPLHRPSPAPALGTSNSSPEIHGQGLPASVEGHHSHNRRRQHRSGLG